MLERLKSSLLYRLKRARQQVVYSSLRLKKAAEIASQSKTFARFNNTHKMGTFPAKSGCDHHRISGVGPVELCDVRFWPGTAAVSSSSRTFVLESVFDPSRLRTLVFSDAVPRSPQESTYGGLATSIGSGGDLWSNYYHVLVDALPRLWWLNACRSEDGDICVYLTSRHLPYMSLIKKLLPENIKTVVVEERTCVRAGRYLLLPQISGSSCGWLPPPVLSFMRERLSPQGPKDGKGQVLFVSREDARYRRIVNENLLRSRLASAGVQCVKNESLSIDEQIHRFGKARKVIGMHGAGLTNMLFARNASVLEIFSGPTYGHYECLARAAGHEYQAMPGPSSRKNDDRELTPGEIDEIVRFAES